MLLATFGVEDVVNLVRTLTAQEGPHESVVVTAPTYAQAKKVLRQLSTELFGCKEQVTVEFDRTSLKVWNTEVVAMSLGRVADLKPDVLVVVNIYQVPRQVLGKILVSLGGSRADLLAIGKHMEICG
jgi:hypothetical protein